MIAGFRGASWRDSARQICAAMALAMALVSLPAVTGIFVRAAGAPCFTANICHPLQSAFPVSETVALARPAALASEIALLALPAAFPAAKSLAARLLDAPDPPPPKLPA
jgi:hypothetical protein